jgi:hypothetical protein
MALMVCNFIPGVLVTAAIAYLLVVQFRIICRNTTSIEVSVRRWAEVDAREAKMVHSLSLPSLLLLLQLATKCSISYSCEGISLAIRFWAI